MIDLRDQSGGALLFVTMVGLVISMGFGLFMGSTVVGEGRAIEAQLARSRAYWQQMGNFNYAISRIYAGQLCSGSGCSGNQPDTNAAAVLQAYFNELTNYRTYTYLDEAPGYSITTTVAATADDRPGRHNFSGHFMARSSYTTSSLVAASAGALPLMELRFCNVPTSSGSCGNITNNNGSNRYSHVSINRLTNLPSP